MRLKEMVSMGVGNKPFLDIQPSDAAISDRAVHYIMKSRGNSLRSTITWMTSVVAFELVSLMCYYCCVFMMPTVTSIHSSVVFECLYNKLAVENEYMSVQRTFSS